MSSAERSPHILELDKASFSYDDEGFISGLSFGVGEAEFVGLLGPNGSGKSTVLKLLSGIIKPAKGTVTLWGKELSAYRHKDRAKLVSYLPQTLDMNVPFTVREIAAMGLYPYDTPPELGVTEALELVGLADKADTMLGNLSGGERRRAYIAMTLLQGAGIVLLDEPMANLDIRYQVEIMRLLRGLNESRAISILMALHDVNLAFEFDRLVLIKDGNILGQGEPGEMLTEQRIVETFDIAVSVHRHDGGHFISYGTREGR